MIYDICFAATKTFPKDKGFFVKVTLNIQTSRHNTMKTTYTLQAMCETPGGGKKLRNKATNLINTVDTFLQSKLGPLAWYSLTVNPSVTQGLKKGCDIDTCIN